MTISNEAKIGLMGTVALILLFMGINFLKGMPLFTTEATYYIQFTNAKGLSKNSAVYADGFNVGRVADVQYDFTKPGHVLIEISVDDNLRIPRQSIVSLDEGVLGGCTLNMRLAGDVNDIYQEDDTIQGSASNGMMEKASALVPKVEPIIEKFDSLITTLNQIASHPSLPMILQNAEHLTQNLNQSTLHLNHLLSCDIPQMASTFSVAGDNLAQFTAKLNELDLQNTLAQVERTIQDISQTMDNFQNPNGTIGRLMTDSQLYDNLNQTAGSADQLLRDLKANPKRYVHFSLFGRKDKSEKAQ